MFKAATACYQPICFFDVNYFSKNRKLLIEYGNKTKRTMRWDILKFKFF